MADIILWRKNEQFDKKDFNVFMTMVATQARRLQQERGLPVTGLDREVSSDDGNGQASAKPRGGNFNKFKRLGKTNNSSAVMKTQDQC